MKKIIFTFAMIASINSCSTIDSQSQNVEFNNPEFSLAYNELQNIFIAAEKNKSWPNGFCDETYRKIFDKSQKALDLIKKGGQKDLVDNLTELNLQAKAMIDMCRQYESGAYAQLSLRYLKADMLIWNAQLEMLKSSSSYFTLSNVQQSSSIKETENLVPFKTFKDCNNSYCTEMVVLPKGSFLMGGSNKEHIALNVDNYRVGWETPQHQVNIRKNFAISKTEVTVNQYATFVKETNRKTAKGALGFPGYPAMNETDYPMYQAGLSWENPGFPQTGDSPVTCVTRKDAEDYAKWLSIKTGKKYRLPTEAEWEYAAKAGTETAFFWGDNQNDGCQYAAVYDESTDIATGFKFTKINCNDQTPYTAKVGSFKPNNWGLYDVTGNAREFVADAWEDTYNSGPYTEEARVLGVSQFPVLRGGAWNYMPQNIRTSYRSAYYSWLMRSNMWGFRLVREL